MKLARTKQKHLCVPRNQSTVAQPTSRLTLTQLFKAIECINNLSSVQFVIFEVQGYAGYKCYLLLLIRANLMIITESIPFKHLIWISDLSATLHRYPAKTQYRI